MRQHEFILRMYGTTDLPGYAKVKISADDYRNWQKHIEYIQKHQLLCVEILDTPHQFLDDVSGNVRLDELELVASDFQPEVSRLVILEDGIYYSGDLHCGEGETSWYTQSITLHTLNQHFQEVTEALMPSSYSSVPVGNHT